MHFRSLINYKDFKFPCTYKPGRNSKAFEDSIDEILREKYPEQWKKRGGK